MCDYSLHLVTSRPAKVGDKLVSTKFLNSITRGFAAIGEPKVAVCLLRGTELAFENNVECEPALGFLPTKVAAGYLSSGTLWGGFEFRIASRKPRSSGLARSGAILPLIAARLANVAPTPCSGRQR